MTESAAAVIAAAMELDSCARAEIALELLASLDSPADDDVDAAWAAEIERRVADIEAGTVELVPWEDVKRRIDALLGR